MYETFIKPLAADVKNFLLDTLFPITCTSCGKEGNFLCAECQSQLQKLDFQMCIMCHKPSPLGLTHSGCQTPFGPNGLVSFFDYHDKKISESIINGKYYFINGIYKLFGQLVANEIKQREYFQLFTGGNFSLVPIPLFKTRERWRGFNQAEVLCQELSAELNLPLANILTRTKNTKTQKDLKRDDRIHNLDSAFALNSKYIIHNSNFVLVDDVTTTGSTLLEAAKVLKRNGAGQVWCLTIARD